MLPTVGDSLPAQIAQGFVQIRGFFVGFECENQGGLRIVGLVCLPGLPDQPVRFHDSGAGGLGNPQIAEKKHDGK